MDYYLYFLGTDGRVASRIGLVCSSDDEAVKKANQLVKGHAAELWQEGRLVARLPEIERDVPRNIS